jgi:hypothetical protein
MKKSDLKSGMIIERRNGDKGMVLLNTSKGDIIGGGGGSGYKTWGGLDNYNDDLTYNSCGIHGYDIVKIYDADCNMGFGSFGTDYLNLIWTRPVEPIELTMEQIADKFNIEVSRLKIIK